MLRDPLMQMTLVAPRDNAVDQMIATAAAQVVVAETHRLKIPLIGRRVEVKAHEGAHARAGLSRVALGHYHLLREQQLVGAEFRAQSHDMRGRYQRRDN